MNQSTLPDIGPAISHSIDQAKIRLQSCADAGLFRHAVSEQSFGFGNTFLDLVKAHEALGKQTRDPGLVLAINAHVWGGVFSIQRFGSQELKDVCIPALLDGRIIAGHAITEPFAGSNTQAMTTNYFINDEQIILNGHKRYITNTPLAGMMIVYAKEHGSNRISAFIVNADDEGARFFAEPAVDGCSTATMGDIILTDCSIPKTRQLGKSGAGKTMIQLTLELERAFIFAGITGVMEWQLEQAVNHCRRQSVDKTSLAQHQAITHKVAEMKLRLDTARLWIRHCAELLDTRKRITSASAQAKLYASEAFLQSSLDLIHIFGASGLTPELTSLVKDATAGRLMSGSSEIQKNIIAAMLGLQRNSNA